MSKGRAVWQRPDVLYESDVQTRAVKSGKKEGEKSETDRSRESEGSKGKRR